MMKMTVLDQSQSETAVAIMAITRQIYFSAIFEIQQSPITL